MTTLMTVTADEKVEMSLDDLVKLERKQQQQQKKKPIAPAAAGGAQNSKQNKRGGVRKPVLKQTQAGQTRKPGQAAKQSVLQAQSKRNLAINNARGIQPAPMVGVTTAGAAGGKKRKKKKASPAPKKMSIKVSNVQANGGGRRGGVGGGGVTSLDGGVSGKKAADFVFDSAVGNGGSGGGSGESFGPGGFKLPKGTTLKISINNTANAATATTPVNPMAAQRKKKQQQPQQMQVILNRSSGPRVSMKAMQAERQAGAGALARRMGRISVTQNTRQMLFNQSRGLPPTAPQQLQVTTAGGGGKTKKKISSGGGMGGGNPRQVIVRRRVK